MSRGAQNPVLTQSFRVRPNAIGQHSTLGFLASGHCRVLASIPASIPAQCQRPVCPIKGNFGAHLFLLLTLFPPLRLAGGARESAFAASYLIPSPKPTKVVPKNTSSSFVPLLSSPTDSFAQIEKVPPPHLNPDILFSPSTDASSPLPRTFLSSPVEFPVQPSFFTVTMLSRAMRVPRAALPLRARAAAPVSFARSVTTNAASSQLSHSVPEVCGWPLFLV